VEIKKKCSNTDCGCDYILNTETDALVKFYCCSDKCNEIVFEKRHCGVLPKSFLNIFHNGYKEKYNTYNELGLI